MVRRPLRKERNSMSTKLREYLKKLTSNTEYSFEEVEVFRQNLKDLLDPSSSTYDSERSELLRYIKEYEDSKSFNVIEKISKSLLEAGITYDVIKEKAEEWKKSDDINLSSLSEKLETSLKRSPIEQDRETQSSDLLSLTEKEKNIIALLCELRFSDEASKRYRAFRLFPEELVREEPRHMAVLVSKTEMASDIGKLLKHNGFQMITSYSEAIKSLDRRKYYSFIVMDLAQPRYEEVERLELEAAKALINKLFEISDKLVYINFSLKKLSEYLEIKYNDQWYYYSLQKVDSNPYVISKIKEDLYSLKLEDELLSEQHREILWLFTDPTARKLVYRKIKTGFSGSSNYLVYKIDDYEQTSDPIIIKITTSEKAIEEESKYINIIQDWIPSSPSVTKKVYKNENIGAVCYQYAHGHPGIQSRTLKDMYIEKYQIDKLCEIIKELFESKLMKFNHTRGLVSRTVQREFSDYIKSYEIALNVGSILPGILSDDNVVFYGREFPNPIKFWDYLKMLDETFVTKRVHGDLHGENIMVDDRMQVYLIDYAKAKDRGHLFTDYAMLEVSIKLDLLDRSTPYTEIIKFEEFLSSWGSLTDEFTYDCQYKEVIDCLKLIKCIRKSANSLITITVPENETFDPIYHYFLALFCLTFAQLAYKDMNQQYALISSGLLASRLEVIKPRVNS